MSMPVGGIVWARPRAAARGFSLIELLVVMSVILILAAIALPTIVASMSKAESTKCLTQLGQLGKGYLWYVREYDSWLLCGGSQGTVMFDNNLGGTSYIPTYELPWFRPAWAESAGFLYSYEALQPYLAPTATAANAQAALMDPNGPDYLSSYNPGNPQPYLRAEQARLMRIFTCPSKPGAPVGYGYNYTAPFGNSYCYPNNRDRFRWYRNAADSLNDTNGYDHPVDYAGNTVPLQILWYEQYVHASTITSPSMQAAWVDTGQINANTMGATDSRLWRETGNNNDYGYVRFPLMRGYWPPTSAVLQYTAPIYAWRPIGRHGGRANGLFFDGGARSIPMLDLCSPSIQWGDPECLFDNRPPTRPPISPLRPYDETQGGGNK